MPDTIPLLGHTQQCSNAGNGKHLLSSAAVSMLAIGGTIGTGLFFSVATLIARGPLMALAAMFYVAFLVVIVLEITTELAVFLPGGGLICRFTFLFLGEPLGLANSVVYWLSWGLTYALELSIAVSICEFWAPEITKQYQTWIILLFWVVITTFNLFPVDVYGQIELYISLIKVLAIIAWIVVISTSLVSKHEFFSVWTNDWPSSFTGSAGSWPKLAVAFMNCLIFLSFIFQSVESIAITTGDIREPHVTIPKVSKIIFVRIVVFYLASVLLLTLLVPFSDSRLNDPSVDNLLSSPFLIAMINCGFPSTGILLLTFNFVIFTAIISAANSNVYFGSRFLESIVQTHFPGTKLSIFARRSDNDVPVAAVIVTSAIGLSSLLLKFHSISVIFQFLLTCCALAGMLMWLLLCWLHIRFLLVLHAQGVSRKSLKYCSGWRLEIWSWFALVNLTLILLLNGLTNYWEFSWLALLGLYMTPMSFLVLWLCFGGYKGSGMLALEEVDISSGDFKWDVFER